MMTDEFRVRAAPKVAGKRVNLFKMHKDDNLSWTEAKMRRENDYQPWQIKLGNGRAARRFKAIKEGGVGENASYFIFYKTKDSPNTFEVCPIDDWYNVSATQRYKTLTAEEAEQKFEQRHKTLNLFSVMVKKGAGEGGPDGEGGSASDSKGFKISEMDEWDQSGDDFGASDDDQDGEGGGARKKARGRGVKKEKEDPEDAPEEGKEDSDEGDFEQREVDYMSDSSSESSVSESGEAHDVNDVRGIAESEALRDLLDTDDEGDAEGSPRKVAKPAAIKSSFDNNHDEQRDNQDDEGSDDSSDSDDYDVDEDKMDTMFMKRSLPATLVKREQLDHQDQGSSNGSTSNLATPTIAATTSSSSGLSSRKSEVTPTISSSATTSSSSTTTTAASTTTTTTATTTPQSSGSRRTNPVEPTSPANTYERTIEDLIIKYLSRKPMTLKSILMTIRSKLKKMGIEIEKNIERDNELVNTIASIIKRLPTERQKINNSMYVSLRQ